MLPSPPSRNNFGSADLSPHGLLAFPSSSSISIIDTRSMQLLFSFPIPPPPSSVVPFVTALRWSLLPLSCHLLSSEPSSSYLLLAIGDHQGCIGLLDFRLRSVVLWFDTDSKLDAPLLKVLPFSLSTTLPLDTAFGNTTLLLNTSPAFAVIPSILAAFALSISTISCCLLFCNGFWVPVFLEFSVRGYSISMQRGVRSREFKKKEGVNLQF
ncbi:hypothetical protein RJT34_27410 [Clitoria ternatea]|uniref:WDR11 first beta-propeller domain-containing protein n=1 Tax=Clitoria ternatea TaxID=43366 RepID=A0AAN9F7U4_CLITE